MDGHIPKASATFTKVAPTLTETAAPTIEIISVATEPSTPVPISMPTAYPTAVPNPLEFVYPTEGASLTLGWRPPLYPTPWAPSLYDHFFFASPIAANETNTPVEDYRYGGMYFEEVVHTGIDIPAPTGTPILAAGSGKVIWSGYGIFQGGTDPNDPYGLAVAIQHDFGYQDQSLFTIYGHMDKSKVIVGQHVDTGDPIGLVGETGAVTGPHLHFEVRVGENNFFSTRNPELWLVPPIGWGIIVGRVMDTAGVLINDQMVIITDPVTKNNSFAWSYGKEAVNSDSYYRENLVVGEIPAGSYTLRTAFYGVNFTKTIEVQPGMVNYFVFKGYKGFSIEMPPAPGSDFTPVPAP